MQTLRLERFGSGSVTECSDDPLINQSANVCKPASKCMPCILYNDCMLRNTIAAAPLCGSVNGRRTDGRTDRFVISMVCGTAPLTFPAQDAGDDGCSTCSTNTRRDGFFVWSAFACRVRTRFALYICMLQRTLRTSGTIAISCAPRSSASCLTIMHMYIYFTYR